MRRTKFLQSAVTAAILFCAAISSASADDVAAAVSPKPLNELAQGPEKEVEVGFITAVPKSRIPLRFCSWDCEHQMSAKQYVNYKCPGAKLTSMEMGVGDYRFENLAPVVLWFHLPENGCAK